jgi:RNA recognition motif-containing protein
MNIYVGNLSYSVTEDDLRQLFGQYGEVTAVNIITDRFTGQPKGFAFVEMAQQEEAQAAIQKLAGTEHMGRNIKVSEARPKGDKPRRRDF